MNELQKQIETLRQEVSASNARVNYLEGVVGALVFSDRYNIGKTMQFQDGRNIQVGKGVGTKIGTESTQKIGFFGKTPIVRPAAISTTLAAGGTYSQAVEDSYKIAIDDIKTVLINLGLTA